MESDPSPTDSTPLVAKRETALSCRERADADLLESAAMINDNQRQRMESSAAIWASRASLLQRLEDSAERRRTAPLAPDESPVVPLED